MKCAARCTEPQSTACTQNSHRNVCKNIAKVRRNRVSGLFKSGQESQCYLDMTGPDSSRYLWNAAGGHCVNCLLFALLRDNEIEQLLLWFTWVWWHHGPSHRFIQRRVWWEFWTGTWVCSGLLSSHRIIPWLCPSLFNDRFLVWSSVFCLPLIGILDQNS